MGGRRRSTLAKSENGERSYSLFRCSKAPSRSQSGTMMTSPPHSFRQTSTGVTEKTVTNLNARFTDDPEDATHAGGCCACRLW
ncbi:hypothetical protein PAXRUDRAFT_827594 [Paxillus rubicundulus Ve08.2h10]|uniref:Uncharacterized protein n=1 Tax=Paxillus rubicundulus Ve08.2h10 TaxID=930991 RepID=A0A0D0E2K1_9AGAM|nr:hypothetical protein PAXRUDRAFT_827594 [Paxillus rubicundulus Ve08.2h10]